MKILKETNLGVVILITSFSYSSKQALHSIFAVSFLSNNKKTEPKKGLLFLFFKTLSVFTFPFKKPQRTTRQSKTQQDRVRSSEKNSEDRFFNTLASFDQIDTKSAKLQLVALFLSVLHLHWLRLRLQRASFLLFFPPLSLLSHLTTYASSNCKARLGSHSPPLSYLYFPI